ncbi:colicin transporter [uncultured Caballeronia sp.]|uniref:colicin transporter n=1 Tax=uncultured Caballeronia sp. TaxID=1827198 RepID=UPI0035CC4434
MSNPLAITLPTSRLSPALPTVPVDLFATRHAARSCSRWFHPLRAAMAVLACAGFVQAAMAQTPRPINPGTSVTESPLDDARAASANAASPADADTDANGFGARQKALDTRSEENNYRYAVKQHDCYNDFFVNHCLNAARAAKRDVSQEIRKQQLALDDEQRLQHAQQRDQQTALKRAQYEADAPQRAATEKASAESFAEKQRQNALSEAQRTAEAPQRAQNQAAYDRKQADYQKKLDDAAARGAQDARDRDAKAERYEAKQRDAAEHQAEVQARQKEAAVKQQQRAQQEAADRAHQEQLKQQQQQQSK